MGVGVYVLFDWEYEGVTVQRLTFSRTEAEQWDASDMNHGHELFVVQFGQGDCSCVEHKQLNCPECLDER